MASQKPRWNRLAGIAAGAGMLVASVASALAAEPEKTPPQRTLGIVLYDKFELLDVFGPAEVFGNLPRLMKVVMVAETAGPVASTQGPRAMADYGLEDCPELDLILVPGGIGTLKEMKNEKLLTWLRDRAPSADLTMSVCSGSAILAKAGLLDGRRATTNKRSFSLLTPSGPKVDWQPQARWVEDGPFRTSSGVSAGIDMALAVVAELYGEEAAQQIADGTEYDWHKDPNWDPFSRFVRTPEAAKPPGPQ